MKYADISQEHTALRNRGIAASDSRDTEQYWTAEEAFKISLRHALRDDELMQKLTKPQLLKVLAWCSTFRPHEPHVILTIFSKLSA